MIIQSPGFSRRKLYVLTDHADDYHDFRIMDKIDFARANAIAKESSDGERFWRLADADEIDIYIDSI